LQVITLEVFRTRDLLKRFGINLDKLRAFLVAIESAYPNNPYHNGSHAADVVQSTHVLLKNMKSDVADLEALAAIFAAACHDVGHPGVTNNYRVAKRDDGAILYNDVSVNESMHCATTYQKLQNDACNWLDCLSIEQEKVVRKSFIDMVMATDMAIHFKHLKTLEKAIEEHGSDFTKWKDVSCSLALEMTVHAADISNVSKPTDIGCQWAGRVLEEFFAQGDLEREAGLQISPMMDRFTVIKAKSQCAFVDYIVRPTFVAINGICDVRPALNNMTAYHKHWSAILEKEQADDAGAAAAK